MKQTPDTEVIDGTLFELRPHHRTPTKKKAICLRKNRRFTNRYLDLQDEFSGGNIVELGVDQGGSTCFFTKLMQPKKMIAMDISTEPVAKVTEFLVEHDPEGRVQIHWGVDQSDQVAIPEILNDAYGDEALDMVVDDASHLLVPSTASFEMIFPRVRPGGLYILEDWSGDHLVEKGIADALASGEDESLPAKFLSHAKTHPERVTPMSVLICQLMIAAGRNPDWITDIRAFDGFCEVRRGPADIAPNTPISKYVGSLGSWIFENRWA